MLAALTGFQDNQLSCPLISSRLAQFLTTKCFQSYEKKTN
jgi:hypothetical protein